MMADQQQSGSSPAEVCGGQTQEETRLVDDDALFTTTVERIDNGTVSATALEQVNQYSVSTAILEQRIHHLGNPPLHATGRDPSTSTDGRDSSHKPDGVWTPSNQLPAKTDLHVLRHWVLEIIAIFIALGLIAAIVAILAHFDGKVAQGLPLDMNLNTLIALLSTLVRVLMLVAVLEVLGQMKWTWFGRRPHRLIDFQRFDEASRGAFGSARLLSVAPRSFVAVSGSLLVILSLAIGTFTQQSLGSISCPRNVTDQNASVVTAHFAGSFPVNSQWFFSRDPSGFDLVADLKTALFSALVNPGGNDSAISATCSTGNCTFQPYSSIGMCSRCADVSSSVSITRIIDSDYEQITSYTLSSNVIAFFGHEHETSWLNVNSSTGSFDRMDNDACFKALPLNNEETPTQAVFSSAPAVLNATFLFFTNVSQWLSSEPFEPSSSDIVAASCQVYTCLKTYSGKVANGVFEENVEFEQPAFYTGGDNNLGSHNLSAIKLPCVVDDTTYGLQNLSEIPKTPGRRFIAMSISGVNYTIPDDCVYRLSYDYAKALHFFLKEDLFTGSCTQDLVTGSENLRCPSAWHLAPLYNSGNGSFATVSSLMQRFATAFTNRLRTTGSDHNGEPETTLGIVIESAVCVAFNWKWLLLPITLVVASAILLFSMIIHNYRNRDQPVWKSSILPFMFYPPEYDLDIPGGPRLAADLHSLETRATQIQASLFSGMDTVSIEHGVKPDAAAVEVDSLLVMEPNPQA